jgi:hypothetical protein
MRQTKVGSCELETLSVVRGSPYAKHQCSSGKIDETFYINDVRKNQTVEMIIKDDSGKISSSRV